jgi:hypothetical protein
VIGGKVILHHLMLRLIHCAKFAIFLLDYYRGLNVVGVAAALGGGLCAGRSKAQGCEQKRSNRCQTLHFMPPAYH